MCAAWAGACLRKTVEVNPLPGVFGATGLPFDVDDADRSLLLVRKLGMLEDGTLDTVQNVPRV